MLNTKWLLQHLSVEHSHEHNARISEMENFVSPPLYIIKELLEILALFSTAHNMTILNYAYTKENMTVNYTLHIQTKSVTHKFQSCQNFVVIFFNASRIKHILPKRRKLSRNKDKTISHIHKSGKSRCSTLDEF